MAAVAKNRNFFNWQPKICSKDNGYGNMNNNDI
jgi:hypothetical protein